MSLYFITKTEVPSLVDYMYITSITHILQQLHALHKLYICIILFTSVVKNDLFVICRQPTCSMSTRMFVPGHQPGLLLVFYHLWDQNQSGMSVGVIQSLWGTLSWWWNTMIACWGNLPSRLNVRKNFFLKLNFIMFYNIYNASGTCPPKISYTAHKIS